MASVLNKRTFRVTETVEIESHLIDDVLPFPIRICGEAKVSNVFELHDAPDGDLVEEAFGGAEFWLERLDIVAVEIRDADGEWRIFGDKFDRWLLSFGRDSVRSRVANRITLHLSVNHEFDHGDIAKRDYTWNQPE